MKLGIGSLSLLVVAGMTVACSKSDNTAGTDTGAAAASGMAATAGASTGATATPAGSTSAPALTDANIAWILDQANMSDSARGKLAETKGTSADVRSFGKLMMGEHHMLRAEGQALVKKLGVAPTAPAGDQSEAQAKTEMDSLDAMPKGAAWDKANRILGAMSSAKGWRRQEEAAGPVDNAGKRLMGFALESDVHDERLWMPIAKATGALGNTSCLVGTAEQVADSLLKYYRLGVGSFLIRGFDPMNDATEFGRELIPRIKAGAAAIDGLKAAE